MKLLKFKTSIFFVLVFVFAQPNSVTACADLIKDEIRIIEDEESDFDGKTVITLRELAGVASEKSLCDVLVQEKPGSTSFKEITVNCEILVRRKRRHNLNVSTYSHMEEGVPKFKYDPGMRAQGEKDLKTLKELDKLIVGLKSNYMPPNARGWSILKNYELGRVIIRYDLKNRYRDHEKRLAEHYSNKGTYKVSRNGHVKFLIKRRNSIE